MYEEIWNDVGREFATSQVAQVEEFTALKERGFQSSNASSGWPSTEGHKDVMSQRTT
jgi:hypothetical protein